MKLHIDYNTNKFLICIYFVVKIRVIPMNEDRLPSSKPVLIDVKVFSVLILC